METEVKRQLREMLDRGYHHDDGFHDAKGEFVHLPYYLHVVLRDMCLLREPTLKAFIRRLIFLFRPRKHFYD